MKYIALKKNEFHVDNYSIRPTREIDMENIRQWRNSQMSLLRQANELLPADQSWYFKNVIKSLFIDKEPKQLIFSFFKDDQLIGYGGLVNLSWKDKRAEMSFLLDDKRAKDIIVYKEDMNNFIFLIKKVIFKEMKFNRLFTETFAFRKKHISILKENGFKKEGILRNHIKKFNKFHDSIIHGILKGDMC
jgi:hypothetical protein